MYAIDHCLKHRKNDDGFALTELIVGITASVMLFTGVVMGTSAFAGNMSKIERADSAKTAMMEIAQAVETMKVESGGKVGIPTIENLKDEVFIRYEDKSTLISTDELITGVFFEIVNETKDNQEYMITSFYSPHSEDHVSEYGDSGYELDEAKNNYGDEAYEIYTYSSDAKELTRVNEKDD